MGIKYLQTYLKDHPTLRYEICFNWNNNDANNTSDDSAEAKIIVWDCLGWLRRLYRCYGRSKLLFDFKDLNNECKQIIDTFKRFGFELIAFIDGYFCTDKIQEKRRRKLSTLKKIRKNIKLIKQMHATNNQKQRKKLINKLEFVPSSGYATYLEQSLTYNGCKVYRGSGNNDIDKDIAQFVVENQHKIYGILSSDTDFFGFYDLPKHIKLISEFHTKTSRQQCKKKEEKHEEKTQKRAPKPQRRWRADKLSKQSLTLSYYYSCELWDKLGLNSHEERLQLICLCGNDFVKKRPRNAILRRCGHIVDCDAYVVNVGVLQGNDENKSMDEAIANNNILGDIGNDICEDKVITNANTDELIINEIDAQLIDIGNEEVNHASNIKVKHEVDNLLEIIANAITDKSVSLEVNIPDIAYDFYSINTASKTKFCCNVNVTWMDFQNANIFHGGFFFHDIDTVKFSIHQKVASIRYALMQKHLKVNTIEEYIPFYEHNCLDVYKHKCINLREIKYHNSDCNLRLLTKYANFNHANRNFVFQNALQILVARAWIDELQRTALELQFEIRFSLRRVYGSGWPFYRQYALFKRNGIPRIKDLTAQCLYWEVCRLICLNPCNIMPNMAQLFDGPLFHFFCAEGDNGDSNGTIKEIQSKLMQCKQSYNRRKRPNHNRGYNNNNSGYSKKQKYNNQNTRDNSCNQQQYNQYHVNNLNNVNMQYQAQQQHFNYGNNPFYRTNHWQKK